MIKKLFRKYLRNESLDLHEILCGGQLLSCEHIVKTSTSTEHTGWVWQENDCANQPVVLGCVGVGVLT